MQSTAKGPGSLQPQAQVDQKLVIDLTKDDEEYDSKPGIGQDEAIVAAVEEKPTAAPPDPVDPDEDELMADQQELRFKGQVEQTQLDEYRVQLERKPNALQKRKAAGK